MPTYVYKFVETGETIEIQQSFNDPTLIEAVHPATGETMAIKKVFQPVGITFKGGGFYKTDSRSGSGKRSSPDSSKADTATPASTTSGSSDTSSSSTTAAPSSSSGSSPGSSPTGGATGGSSSTSSD